MIWIRNKTLNQMNKKVTNIILLWTGLCTVALFSSLWLIDYSGFSIPAKIPQTEINIYGLLLLATFIIMFILFQKKLIKEEPRITIFQLVYRSLIVGLIAELVYQSFRYCFVLTGNLREKIIPFLASTFVVIIFAGIIALAIAMELKKVKPIWNWIITISLLVVIILSKKYLTDIVDW